MASKSNGPKGIAKRKIECEKCPLRKLELFREFEKDELDFVSKFKSGELTAEAGTTFLTQGTNSAHIYTVLSGWGFRYKDLDDGRRQILNFVFPGELIGLQGAVLSEMEHSVQTLTDMVLCVFERSKLWELFSGYPSLGFDLTWLAAQEEQILENHLLTVGKRTAKERLAYLLMYIFEKARRTDMVSGKSFDMPVTQQQIADTVGMSLVHTNKTLRQLTSAKIISWKRRKLTIHDEEKLAEAAHWEPLNDQARPLI